MVSVAPIAKGVVIAAEVVTVKRPSPGPGAIPAKHLEEVIGKTAKADIEPDRQILWDEVGE